MDEGRRGKDVGKSPGLQRPRGLARPAVDGRRLFGAHLALGDAALADAHAARHVPLRHDPDRQRQRLLHPLGHPLARVDAAALDDLRDRLGHNGARDVRVRRGVVGVRGRGRVEPVDPPLRHGLRERVEGDAVDWVVQVDGEADLLVLLLVGDFDDALRGWFFGRRRRAGLEQLLGCGLADGLDGQEDVAAPHGVRLAQHLRRLLRGRLDPAPRGVELVGVCLGAGARQLGRLDGAPDGVDAAGVGRGDGPPPGPVAPAGAGGLVAAVLGSPSSGSGFLTPLDDHEIAALHLGHDAGEDGVDQGVQAGVTGEVVRDVDLETLMGGDGRGQGVEERGECGERKCLQLAACM